MKRLHTYWCLLLLPALPVLGCGEKASPQVTADPEADIRANLAALGPADQALAEKQQYCPVMPEVRLGEMGPPRKVTVQGQTIFVCCENCAQRVQEEPEQALVQIKEFKQRRLRR